MHLTPITRTPSREIGAPPYLLAFGVAGTTMLILFLALMASLYDQRSNILAALEAGGVGYWELDLRDWRLHLSPKGKTIFGIPPEEALSYSEALDRIAPGSRLERQARVMEAIRTGMDYDVEYPLAEGDRWVNARGRTVSNGGDRPTRMVGVVIDVTERRLAVERIVTSERRQRLLVDELNHRVKNTLATVQSISRHTVRGASSLEDFHRYFEARLMALSATHNELTLHGWEKAGFLAILTNELKRQPAEQITLLGDDVELDARQALALGMVTHELVINAVRHGALANPSGRLEISWRIEERMVGATLVLDWREQDVSNAGATSIRPGFGMRVIHRSIEGELEGEARMDLDPEGISWHIAVPMPSYEDSRGKNL